MSLNRPLSRRLFVAGSVAAGLTVSTTMTRAQPGVVRLGVIGISFHAIAGAVVQTVLERLGKQVTVQQAPHDEMFRRLGGGEVDLLVAAWMPGTHRHLFEPFADRLAPLATLYRNAQLYWTVPDYVPAELVSSVDDLVRPEVMTRMDRTIRSIGPSAGLSVRSATMLSAYGLDVAGYRVEPGETSLWLKNFRAAHAARQWLVMPLWQPHFLNQTHQLRRLKDPQGVMGSADDAVIIANTVFARSLDPRSARVLAAIDIGLDGITEMDVAVNVGGLTPAEAAVHWLGAEDKRVAEWLDA
jgi:glycine betaine/proline transport system substrate-binding protein